MQAFYTVVYLINLLPTRVLHNQAPIQLLFHKTPNYHHLCVYECLCFPYLCPYMANKLSYRSAPCVFFKFSSPHKGYGCLDISTRCIYILCHVLFHEHYFPFRTSTNYSSPIQSSPLTVTPILISSPSLLQPLQASTINPSIVPLASPT